MITTKAFITCGFVLLIASQLPTLRADRAEQDNQSATEELESAFNRATAKVYLLPPEERKEYVNQLASAMGSIIAGWTAYPDRQEGSAKELSNACLADAIYAAFGGDLAFLMKKARQDEASAKLLIEVRVKTMVAMYPISTPASFSERAALVQFLAKGATVVPDSVRASSRARLAEVAESDRLPLLIALAGLGDQEAQKSLKPLDSAEAKKLQRTFQVFSKRP